MSLDDGLSTFLGSLYEAVYDADDWRSGMEEVIARTGCQWAAVGAVDQRRARVDDVQFHGPNDRSFETGMREYREEMFALDPVLTWIMNNPSAGICDSSGIIDPGEYSEQPIIKWVKGRYGTEFWRVYYGVPLDGFQFSLTLHANDDDTLRGREKGRLQALVFENLERAVRLAGRPPNFAADDSALIAVDRCGRVLSLSLRAEEILRDADGLAIKGGILSAQMPENDAELQRAIAACVRPTRDELSRRGIRIERGPGKADLFLVASYLPASLNHLAKPVPTALIRLVELDIGPEHLNEHSHLFDLTPREIEIAKALLDGHSLESMAELLTISRNTARNHLQALFEKTKTNRQSHLVQVLERVSRQ